jgi:hypothetical protein
MLFLDSNFCATRFLGNDSIEWQEVGASTHFIEYSKVATIGAKEMREKHR